MRLNHTIKPKFVSVIIFVLAWEESEIWSVRGWIGGARAEAKGNCESRDIRLSQFWSIIPG